MKRHYFKFFVLWMVVLLGCGIYNVFAQEVVEVESDVMPGVESEEELERLQEKLKPSVEMKTKLMSEKPKKEENVSDAAGKKEGQNKAADQKEDVLEQELLDTEIKAAEADVLSEDEILQINESLRSAIKQNRRLQQEKQKMDEELKTLRGERRLEKNRVTEMKKKMTAQKEEFEERMQSAAEMKQEFETMVADLQEKIKTREQALQTRIQDLQKKLAESMGVDVSLGEEETAGKDQGSQKETAQAKGDLKKTMSKSGEQVIKTQKEGLDVINLLDQVDDMRQQMQKDEAKVHYNMANIFFHQGKYDEAVEEYRKTLEITPGDANAHFNLAYVSSEFLHEYPTAVEHYKQYLRLNPDADDAPLVQEKIIEAQLYIRTRMNVEVDKESYKDKPRKLYTW